MSNKYIASFLHISERQVTRYIAELKALGWIEETSFNGRKRYLKSLLRFNLKTGDPDRTKVSGRPRQICPGRLDKSVQYNKQVNKPINKQFNSFKEKEKILEKGDRYWNEDILLLKRKKN